MQSNQAAILNTLIRVQRFIDANKNALGTINDSGYRSVLDDVVDTLGNHALSQTSSKRASAADAAKERVLRNTLKLNHMRPIASIAAAQLRQVPEFVALKMPPANSTSRALISAAGAMVSAASIYQKTFVAAGLSDDFGAQTTAAAAALADSIANRGASRTIMSGATAGLTAEATRGRQAVKVLDSLIEPQLAGNIVLLARWKAAKRFGGKSAPIASTTIDAAARGPADQSAPAAPEVPSPAAPSPSASTPPASTPSTTGT